MVSEGAEGYSLSFSTAYPYMRSIRVSFSGRHPAPLPAAACARGPLAASPLSLPQRRGIRRSLPHMVLGHARRRPADRTGDRPVSDRRPPALSGRRSTPLWSSFVHMTGRSVQISDTHREPSRWPLVLFDAHSFRVRVPLDQRFLRATRCFYRARSATQLDAAGYCGSSLNLRSRCGFLRQSPRLLRRFAATG